MVDNEESDIYLEEKHDPKASSKNLDKIIAQLNDRFGRLPSENEVYRFIRGDANTRQRIWSNKGLPEALR